MKIHVVNGVQIVEDPRKDDLRYDSNDWTVLLTTVHAVDPMAAGALHGFRCGGLRLHRGARGYALRPDYDPATSIWTSESEYKRDRDEWLVPHTDTIVKALNTLENSEAERRMTA